MTNHLKFLVPSLFIFAAACGSKSTVDDGPHATPEECAGLTNEGSVIGQPCEVASDCGSDYLFCHVGACAAPDDPALLCDGGSSPLDGYECGPLGYLVPSDLACATDNDCATGYSCGTGSTCAADADACPDRDEPQNLRGTWEVATTLHLREAIGGVGGTIGDIAEIVRGIKNGNLDSDQLEAIIHDDILRATVVSLINSLGQQALNQYVSADALKIADILASISDVMDETEVAMKINIGGQACDYSYRGTATWETISFELAGEPVQFRPAQIPAVGIIESEEFTVMNACGTTYFDQARYHNLVSKVPAAIVEYGLAKLTDYPNLDAALSDLINCQGIAKKADGSTDIFKKAACDALVSAVVEYGKGKLNDLGKDLKILTLQGYATPQQHKIFTDGVWKGSIVGAKFSGDFTGSKE